MSKVKKKTSYKGVFDRVSIQENDESEFKIGFVFIDEIDNPDRYKTARDEARIADVSKEIYYAYRRHRYRYEEGSGSNHTRLQLADGSTRLSYHAEQNKENRFRSFLLLANTHPKDLEMRVEVRDGKKILMIKKGNGVGAGSPIIRRHELKLTGDARESDNKLLSRLPKFYKDTLGFEFNSKSGLYLPMKTNSQRLKTKVRELRDTSAHGALVFHIELAHDLGSGITSTGLRWPIREYEAEVKGIYQLGDKVDIKKHPDVLGLKHQEIGKMCEEALRPEQEDFLEFAMLYLLENAKDNPERYADIWVEAVYHSKSSPGRTLLEPVMQLGRKKKKTVLSEPHEDFVNFEKGPQCTA